MLPDCKVRAIKNFDIKSIKIFKLCDVFDYIRNQTYYSTNTKGRLMTSFLNLQRVGFWLSWNHLGQGYQTGILSDVCRVET